MLLFARRDAFSVLSSCKNPLFSSRHAKNANRPQKCTLTSKDLVMATPTHKHTLTIPASLLSDRASTKDKSAEIAVAAVLSWIADSCGQSFVEAKTETIAKSLGWSKRKAVEVLKRLERNSYITVEHRPPSANYYHLPWLSHLSPPPTSPHPQAQPATPIPPPANSQPNLHPNSLHTSAGDHSQALELAIENRITKLEKTTKNHKVIFSKIYTTLESILERLNTTPSDEQTSIVVDITTPTPTSADVQKPSER